MSSLPPLRVFLVDPMKCRRDQLERDLLPRFEVSGFGAVGDAATAAQEVAPHAVVFSLRQIEAHGLAAATELRKVVGPSAFIAVVGAPDKPVREEVRVELLRRHAVDWWNGRAVETTAIEALLWTEMVRRVSRPASQSEAPRAPGLFERLRAFASGLSLAA